VIAALFIETNGCYSKLDNVDPWDVDRNAMLYNGPYPVVAHPPCSRWCRLAGLVEARWGYKRGDDGGMFAHALHCVRTYGGILEHPAYSDAWARYDLPTPNRHSGWQRGFCGGWACHVEQSRYGHRAKKATWLYAFGTELPLLRWGSISDSKPTAAVSWCRNHCPDDQRPRLGKKEARATPIEFREQLIRIAESAIN